MMIVMKETATAEEVEAVVEKIERAGARAHRSKGARVTVIGAIGDVEQDASVESLGLEGQPGVDRVRADPQALQARLAADHATASAPCSTSTGARSAASTSR